MGIAEIENVTSWIPVTHSGSIPEALGWLALKCILVLQNQIISLPYRFRTFNKSELGNVNEEDDANFTISFNYGFYSSHTVCLPSFFPDPERNPVWEYSFFLLLINFFAFFFMLIAYIFMYR